MSENMQCGNELDVVTDRALEYVSARLSNNEWRDVGRKLKIINATLENISEDNSRNIKEVKYQMLLSWQQQNGYDATYGILCNALRKAGRKDLADNLLNHVENDEEVEDGSSIGTTYLATGLVLVVLLVLVQHNLNWCGKQESTGKMSNTSEEVIENARKLCARGIVYIRDTDNISVQNSTIELLNVASIKGIPLTQLYLMWSFREVDGNCIILDTGLCLSSLSTVKKISINGRNNIEFSKEDLIELIKFGLKSPKLTTLRLFRCKVPTLIENSIIPENSITRNIKVIWTEEARYLHLESGEWKMPNDTENIREICSDVLFIYYQYSESRQKSVIAVMKNASNHDIPIYKLSLTLSFDKIDEDGNIILSSGLALPNLTSLERMNIQTEAGRAINQQEVNGILNYVLQSQRFMELKLKDCLRPPSIGGALISALKSQGINVFWLPDSKEIDQYQLYLDRPMSEE